MRLLLSGNAGRQGSRGESNLEAVWLVRLRGRLRLRERGIDFSVAVGFCSDEQELILWRKGGGGRERACLFCGVAASRVD